MVGTVRAWNRVRSPFVTASLATVSRSRYPETNFMVSPAAQLARSNEGAEGRADEEGERAEAEAAAGEAKLLMAPQCTGVHKGEI